MYKVTITKTSDWKYEEKTEIETLDKLVKYADKYECNSFVVYINSDTDVDIEIYDTWRE